MRRLLCFAASNWCSASVIFLKLRQKKPSVYAGFSVVHQLHQFFEIYPWNFYLLPLSKKLGQSSKTLRSGTELPLSGKLLFPTCLYRLSLLTDYISTYMNEPSLHHLVRKEPTCLAIAQVCHSCWLISIIYTFGTRKVSGDERLLPDRNSPSARAAPRNFFIILYVCSKKLMQLMQKSRNPHKHWA